MKVLKMTLKKKWFDMIASGEKKEEYREIKQYWVSRFIDFLSGRKIVLDRISEINVFFSEIEDGGCDVNKKIQWRHYDAVEFKNGYSKAAPAITLKLNGIEIKEGRKDCGAEECEKYFVLKLGEIILI